MTSVANSYSLARRQYIHYPACLKRSAARSRFGPARFDIGVRDSWKRALDSVTEAWLYAVPDSGRSVRPSTRRHGFANWARELATQEAQLDTFFDTVIVCTVTGSTHAGMIAGFALEDRDDRKVIGIDASKTLDQTIDQVTRIGRRRVRTSTLSPSSVGALSPTDDGVLSSQTPAVQPSPPGALGARGGSPAGSHSQLMRGSRVGSWSPPLRPSSATRQSSPSRGSLR